MDNLKVNLSLINEDCEIIVDLTWNNIVRIDEYEEEDNIEIEYDWIKKLIVRVMILKIILVTTTFFRVLHINQMQK